MPTDDQTYGPGPPLAGHYGATVALVLLALCPDLVASTAMMPLAHTLPRVLHTSPTGVQTAESLSNAGYAVGAVLAADLIQRLRLRHLFLACEALFVAGCLTVAAAPGVWVFGAGRVVQGLATGLLLVIALPPLVTRFGAGRMPSTATFVNIGLFGAVTAGPLIGGGLGATGAWRWFHVSLAVAGAAGAALGAATLGREDPFNPAQRFNAGVFPLAVAGTALPFLGVSRLAADPAASPLVWAPVVVGLVALVVLMAVQRARSEALMPIRPLARVVPLTGVLCAMVAGAAFVAVLTGVVGWTTEARGAPPLEIVVRLWPMAAAVGVAAALFGVLFRTRWVPVLAGVGLLGLLSAAGLLFVVTPASSAPVVAAVAATAGFGAGATVSPGLFFAALSVDSKLVGRVFALVELLRSEAAFLLAPVMVHLIAAGGPGPAGAAVGVHNVARVTLAFLGVGGAAVAALYVAGGTGLVAPDLPRWLDQEGVAIDSPQVAEVGRAA